MRQNRKSMRKASRKWKTYGKNLWENGKSMEKPGGK